MKAAGIKSEMKLSVSVLVSLATLLTLSTRSTVEASGIRQYSNKYDHVNVDQVLKNNRLLDNYLRCLLDTGRCTPEGQELKTIVPDAIIDGCAKCNEKQRASSDKIIRHLVKNRAKDWEKLQKKYDPTGEFKAKYQHLLN